MPAEKQEDYNLNLGEKIYELRNAKNVSQGDVVDAFLRVTTGISRK